MVKRVGFFYGEKGGKSGIVIGWNVEMVKSVSCWDGKKGWMVI